MKSFSALYQALDASTATNDKVRAMVDYLRQAAPADAAWTVYFLAGGKPRQAVPSAALRAVAAQAAQVSPWLFEECYAVVGDLAETIAYLTPAPTQTSELTLAQWLEQRIAPLRGMPADEQALRIRQDWGSLDERERFLYVKLIGGGLRVGVSKLLVQRAIAEAFDLDPALVAHRMMGWTDGKQWPTVERYAALTHAGTDPIRDSIQPYPFFLAHPLMAEPSSLGTLSDWLVEWKFDGIRAQLVQRGSVQALWSRGEELISERFPEVMALARRLPPGTVLDGEVLVWLPGSQSPASFALLQRRIGRKLLGAKVLREAPARFVAYDLLEWRGQDLRALPLRQRRAPLEELAAELDLPLSPAVICPDWPSLANLRQESRVRGVEGFMLKQLSSAYGHGRTKSEGLWWKWKIDPYRVDAVLIYAQAGHGRRANVYTDYTFAVWNRAPVDATEAEAVVQAIRERRPPQPDALQLVPFAKAYSGLSDEEFQRVDRNVRLHTVDKFGPVRSVAPSMVFELGFEGISRSPRHKSGIATRFPRMLRIRDDKPLHEAETLQGLSSLLPDSPSNASGADS